MDRAGGKFPGERRGAVVGGKLHRDPAPRQRARERLRRKQVPAGTACRDQDERLRRPAHARAPPRAASYSRSATASARERRLVSAISMPMPKASEISDEPP